MRSFINKMNPPPIECFGSPVRSGDASGPSELVDELDTGIHNESKVPLESWSMMNTITARDEALSLVTKDEVIFSMSGKEAAPTPNGPMWSVTQTIRNEDMLTIFDTGAVKNAVTRNTIAAVGCKWTDKVDISFVNAGGVEYKPLGMCLEFPFKIAHVKFKTKVYILETAPFQLLLGTTFLHATGCGLFPRWNMIVMTIPSRLEIKCSTEGPTRKNSPAPLQVEIDLEEDPMDFGAHCNLMATAPVPATGTAAPVLAALTTSSIGTSASLKRPQE